jgi:hypothetical protein
MIGQLRVVCTGGGRHKERELARSAWVSTEDFDPRKLPGERWDEIKLFTGPHWSQRVDVVDLPEGRHYRMRCTSCRGLNRPAILVADSTLRNAYYAATGISEVRVDVSLPGGNI